MSDTKLLSGRIRHTRGGDVSQHAGLNPSKTVGSGPDEDVPRATFITNFHDQRSTSIGLRHGLSALDSPPARSPWKGRDASITAVNRRDGERNAGSQALFLQQRPFKEIPGHRLDADKRNLHGPRPDQHIREKKKKNQVGRPGR